MKKFFVLLLLCCPAVFAFTQTRSEIAIYIPLISGTGAGQEDNPLLTEILQMEFAAYNYQLVGDQRDSNYSIVGSIAPYEEDASRQLYLFHLELLDSPAYEVMMEQNLLYADLEDINLFLPVMAYNIFNAIPLGKNLTVELLDKRDARNNSTQDQLDHWRNKWLYLGADIFWTPRVYTGDGESVNLVSFGFGVSAEFHFHNFLSTEIGAELAQDWVRVYFAQDQEYRDFMLEVPISLKLVLKPGSHYMFQPYMGMHFNFSFYGVVRPSLYSWMIGFQYGAKMGQNVMFVGPRFSMNIGDSTLGTATEIGYQRYSIHIAAGVKYGVGKARERKLPQN